MILADKIITLRKKAGWSQEELAQKLRKTPRRHDTLGEANPLTGLVFCADCGAKMMNHRSRGGTENNPYPSDFYDCSTYTLAHQKRTHACKGHYIRSKVLRELILETIRAASTFAISDRDAFLEKVRSASQLRQAEATKETKRKLNKEKKRISELDTIIKKLYESFAVGRITGERFDSLLAEYEAEQKALTASVSEMETQMSAFAEDTDRAKQFLELAKKYTDFSELTTPMINEFVEKIIVHAPEKIDGDRVQEVDIHLRFIGQFELPAPELMAKVLFECPRPLDGPEVDAPGGGQADGASAAVKDGHADLVFELADRDAQGRLGDEERLRGLGKALLLVDFIDVAHVLLHGDSFFLLASVWDISRLLLYQIYPDVKSINWNK